MSNNDCVVQILQYLVAVVQHVALMGVASGACFAQVEHASPTTFEPPLPERENISIETHKKIMRKIIVLERKPTSIKWVLP